MIQIQLQSFQYIGDTQFYVYLTQKTRHMVHISHLFQNTFEEGAVEMAKV